MPLTRQTQQGYATQSVSIPSPPEHRTLSITTCKSCHLWHGSRSRTIKKRPAWQSYIGFDDKSQRLNDYCSKSPLSGTALFAPKFCRRNAFPSKRIIGWTIFLQIFETAAALFCRRNRTDLNPPHGKMRPGHGLEPVHSRKRQGLLTEDVASQPARPQRRPQFRKTAPTNRHAHTCRLQTAQDR